MEETRRLFVGVTLPHGVVTIIRKREQQLMRTYPDLPVRWTPLENLHMTVSFLGHVQDARLPELITALENAVRTCASFDMVFDRWMLGPSAAQPKMVWLGTDTPSAPLGALTTAVARVVAPLHPPRGAYRPHVTLGRIAQKRYRALDEVPSIECTTSLVVMVDHVTLFESTVVDGTRAFVPLATCELDTTRHAT